MEHHIRFDDPIPSRHRMKAASFALMQRYMSAIYSMTTVNHDNLFAATIRQIPFNYLDSYDLKCLWIALILSIRLREVCSHFKC